MLFLWLCCGSLSRWFALWLSCVFSTFWGLLVIIVIRSVGFNQQVCFSELFTDFILESSAKNWVFVLLSSVVNGRVSILAEPLFHLIALQRQEVQDCFDSILLGEVLVMHLEVLLFIFSLVFDFIAGLCLPKPVLVCLLVLKLLLVAFGNGSCIPIASGESVVGSLWVLILEQICHLMQNSKAHPVVGFDLLKALRHCFHKWLKVHSELGSFYLDGCNWIFVTASIRLLSIHDCLKYLWLFLDLILSLALFGCKLQKV